MKKKLDLVLLIYCLAFSNAMGQPDSIRIQPPALSANHLTALNVLTGTLVNTSVSSQRIYLFEEIWRNGKRIGNTTSTTFPFAPGPLAVNASNANALLCPVVGNYFTDSDRDYLERSEAMLPEIYEICIDSIRTSDWQPIGHVCYPHTVMDLNPPILVMLRSWKSLSRPLFGHRLRRCRQSLRPIACVSRRCSGCRVPSPLWEPILPSWTWMRFSPISISAPSPQGNLKMGGAMPRLGEINK